jgi:hypothetical protein
LQHGVTPHDEFELEPDAERDALHADSFLPTRGACVKFWISVL